MKPNSFLLLPKGVKFILLLFITSRTHFLTTQDRFPHLCNSESCEDQMGTVAPNTAPATELGTIP